MSDRVVTFGDICEFKYGKALSAQVRENGDVAVFGSNGQVGTHDVPLSTGPTIIIGRKGSVGEVHYCEGPNWAIDTTYYIDQSATECHLRWLAYALKASRIKTLNKAAAVPGLNRNDAYLERVALPPLNEQKRIAAILDKADAMRAKRRQAIVLLDSLTQSIFLEMFGDPVRNPKSWDVAKIGELFNLKHGFAFKSENFLSKGAYVLLTPGNFFEEGGFRERGERQRYHDKPVPNEYILEAGDILVAMTEQAPGLLGSPLIVPEDGKYLHNQRLGKVVKNVDIHSQFIVGLLNTPSVRSRIQADSSGTKVKHTSPIKISDIKIGCPPLSVQKQYATRIKTADLAKSRLLESILKQDKLFYSLQHRAFTGQL